MKSTKILVTGSNGQLGSEIRLVSSKHIEFEFTFVDVAEMDLGKSESIKSYFEHRDFDFIINCAAYTAVDKAEEEPTVALAVNALAVKTLAELCLKKKMRLIHISTDYVFGGKVSDPIDELAVPNPISVYGQTKLAGEQYVLQLLPNAYIIRTAWVYSEFGKNFVKTISTLARQREQLNVVADQIGSPTSARDLATTILAIITNILSGNDKPGIYHFSNEGTISWYDFAFFIVNELNLSCKVNPIKTSEYKTLAERPAYSVLDKTKIKSVFKIEIPHWFTSLKVCLKELD